MNNNYRFGLHCPKCDSANIDLIEPDKYMCRGCNHIFNLSSTKSPDFSSGWTVASGSVAGNFVPENNNN